MKQIFRSRTRWQLVRQIYTLLTLMSFLTLYRAANAQDVSGYKYTTYTSVDAGTWTYGAVSNPFTVTYSGDGWDTKTATSYTPVYTPTGLSNYVQPATMLELGAYVDGTPPSVALFTFAAPLRAGTVFFIQDVDALESFTFEFIDSNGNVLNPNLIGTYNLSNPAFSSFTMSSTMLTVTATDNVNYGESLSNFIINSSLVKQVRITQIASRDDLAASGTAEFYFSASNAQNGYIYVHKKAVGEENSPNFTFNVSGGPTSVSAITLSDQPTTFKRIEGLGGDADGGLWALSGDAPDVNGNYLAYYRAPNSSTWVSRVGAGIDIDGGAAGTRISVAINNGRVYYDNGTVETDVTGNLSTTATNVSDNWQGVQYAVLSNDQIWKRTIPSTTWTQIPGITGKYIDAVPNTNQIVFISSDQLTVSRVNNDGTGLVSLGAPRSGVRELAVSADGTVYTSRGSTDDGTFRYTGSGWIQERGGYQLQNLTGGPATQIWGNIAMTGNATSERIYSRAQTGDYISDENVRLTPNDNASLIAVAPGTYTVTEGAVSGWNLNSITLYETQSASSKNVPARTATLVVSEGEVVHVVFENQLTQSTAITNVCSTSATFLETFGTGTGYGGPLTGLTSYHFATDTYGYGFYSLLNNANLMSPGYTGDFIDHTPGDVNGRMLVVDATIEEGVFYRRRFTGLIPGATYNFTAWAMNINIAGGADKPNVSFNVYDPTSGNLLNSGNSGNITTVGVWQQTSFVFVATQAIIDLELRNNTLGTSGNDLAIDDISFGVGIPQPESQQASATCTGAGSITFTSPLSPSYEYSIDGGVTYQANPVFTSVGPGNYSLVVRYVGAAGCATSPISVSIASAICGNVFNDANGLNDNTVNGTAIDGTSVPQAGGSPVPIYVSLVSNGTILATVPVTATGTYSFTGVAPGSYSVVLTTNAAGSLTSSVPTSWTTTGEHIGTGTGSDGTPNGILTGITVAGSTITNANFGIEVLPTPGSGTAAVANSGGTSPVTAPPSAFTNVTPSTDTAPGSVTAIHITTFPTNVTSLTINGTTYTAGTFPAGGVIVPTTSTGAPTVPILVDPTNDANPVVFTYTAVDNAGKESTTTGTATLNFTVAVPDLAPIIYALPATQYGTTNFTVVVDVYDLLTTPSNGLITLYVTKDPLVNLSFNPASVLVGGRLVQNSIWTFSNTDPDFYIFTTTAVIAGKGKKSFGLTGVLTPGNTQGTLTLSTTIVGGSGGEIRIDNNSDADKIDYFKK